MLKKILSVGGWTLVSRITGFARDIVMAAMTTSRKNPVMRETSVQPPTERIFLNIA